MPGTLPAVLTLHVHDQQGVADGERCPEAHSLRGAQEVPVDKGHSRQVAHSEGHGQSAAQQLREAMCAGQQAQADPTAALAAVQLVQAADVVAEAPGDPAEQCGQPEAQEQIERAVRGALLQEAQAAGQPAAQRELAEQVQLQPLSAPGALAEERPCRWGSGLPAPSGPTRAANVQTLQSLGGWSPKDPWELFPERECCPQVEP